MSPQRPLHRAYQQDPAGGRNGGRTRNIPPSGRRPRRRAPRSGSLMRPGSARTTHAGTTWSPVGQTPQVKNTGARYAVNMISVVSAKGALRFAVYDGTTNAATFIDFCKRLLHDAGGPVYLIVDGHPDHRATATKEFAASTQGRRKPSHPARLLTRAQPRRMGLEERQARPDRQDRRHQQARPQSQGHRRLRRRRNAPDWSGPSSPTRTCATSLTPAGSRSPPSEEPESYLPELSGMCTSVIA